MIPIFINSLGVDLGNNVSCRIDTMEEEVEIPLKGIQVVHQDCVSSWLMSPRDILHNLVKSFVKFINGFI